MCVCVCGSLCMMYMYACVHVYLRVHVCTRMNTHVHMCMNARDRQWMSSSASLHLIFLFPCSCVCHVHVCVCMLTYSGIYMGIYGPVHTCMWKPRVGVRNHTYHSPIILWGRIYQSYPELTAVTSPAGQKALRSRLFLPHMTAFQSPTQLSVFSAHTAFLSAAGGNRTATSHVPNGVSSRRRYSLYNEQFKLPLSPSLKCRLHNTHTLVYQQKSSFLVGREKWGYQRETLPKNSVNKHVNFSSRFAFPFPQPTSTFVTS